MTELGFGIVFGMGLFSKFDMVVDSPNRVIYFHPNQSDNLILSSIKHNRMGASFIPKETESGQSLFAQVVPESPAFEAGIRDNDILLSLNGTDLLSDDLESSMLTLSEYTTKPAGTELDLKLQRSDKVFRAKVILKDLLSPDTN